MRGLIDRRAIAILSRSRASGVFFQRQSFSAAGRGRGRGVEESPVAPSPEIGDGAGQGLGLGLGLGSFGIGRGRGRSSVPSPPPVKPPAPFKPFTLSPAVKPAPVAVPVPVAEEKILADSRFEDAVEPLAPIKPFTLSPAVKPAPVAVPVPEAKERNLTARRFEDALKEKELADRRFQDALREKELADRRFEDAVEEDDVKPSQAPLNVSSDAAARNGGADLSKVEGAAVSKAGGGAMSASDDGEYDEGLLSFRGLLNIGSPGDSSQVGGSKVPFNPFNLPATPSPSMYGGAAGRGRGAPVSQDEGRGSEGRGSEGRGRGAPRTSQIGADQRKGEEASVHVQLSREEARARALALLAKAEEQGSERTVSPSSSPPAAAAAPARPPLSREQAVERAVSVMQEGVERNLSREEERRRRRGSIDSFSDATSMVADRFQRRAAVSSSQQPRNPQSAKDRVKRQPRPFQRRGQEEEPQAPTTLREMTPEDEQRLIALEEEEQFKSSLHTKFLLDFEPEYAMEYFGTNPDIDEVPRKPLEQILGELKPFMMIEGMTDEQWDGEVKDVVERAPHLKSLVNIYAGPDRLTAREQISKLQDIADTMPAHVGPEIKDFMSQAMLSIQSNPGMRMKEKERLMNRFVSGFSSL